MRAQRSEAGCAAALSELKGEGPEAERLVAKIDLLEYEVCVLGGESRQQSRNPLDFYISNRFGNRVDISR